MTDISSEDLREKILAKEYPGAQHCDSITIPKDKLFNLFDIYLERRVKEDLLPWMVEKGVEPYKGANGLPFFYYGKEPHTPDELFQDFL